MQEEVNFLFSQQTAASKWKNNAEQKKISEKWTDIVFTIRAFNYSTGWSVPVLGINATGYTDSLRYK
jgi:hypothetical protein